MFSTFRMRFRLEHQGAPSWPTEIVTHDECERHLHKLSRTACGCMRYGSQHGRPYGRVWMASGLYTETNLARLFLTMSADEPLLGTDYACHRCHDELCAHPDHLYLGDHQSNVFDKLHPHRRIRPRLVPRFYDGILLEIPEASSLPPTGKGTRASRYKPASSQMTAVGAVLPANRPVQSLRPFHSFPGS